MNHLGPPLLLLGHLILQKGTFSFTSLTALQDCPETGLQLGADGAGAGAGAGVHFHESCFKLCLYTLGCSTPNTWMEFG